MAEFLPFLRTLAMMAAPLAIAGMAGLVSERSGVVNVALEGLMGAGAFAAAAVHYALEGPAGAASAWLALGAAMAFGMVFALPHAAATVGLGANQVISGMGINLLSSGLTVFLCKALFGMERTPVFGLGLLPGLWGFYPTLWLALAVVALTWFWLYRLPSGLRLRACGEHPEAAESAGVPVRRVRCLAVLASGALAGLAGGGMVLTHTIQFTRGTIGGAGFMALAAVSLGRWRPGGVGMAASLFGLAVAASVYAVNLDALRRLPPDFFSMLPYAVSLLVLVALPNTGSSPRAAGSAWPIRRGPGGSR
ncbi:MAG TPA: ABC transporter permease [Spirochaetales bacterium]|nr:ABC transporter permease [Spirochaetales bacterium]